MFRTRLRLIDLLRLYTLKYAPCQWCVEQFLQYRKFPFSTNERRYAVITRKMVLAVSEDLLAGLHVLLTPRPSPIWKPLHSCLGLDATTFRGVETIVDTIVSALARTWAWMHQDVCMALPHLAVIEANIPLRIGFQDY